MFKEVFYEMQREKVDNSVGSICETCNGKAFYFNRKNIDFHIKKSCLICSSEHIRGTILEDFVSTLSDKIPDHYQYGVVAKNSV